MERAGGILLLFWLGVTEITSVTRFTSCPVSVPLMSVPLSFTSLLELLLALPALSVPLSFTSLLELLNMHKLFHTTGPILFLIE